MTEKFYVVSESDLQKLTGTFYKYESDDEEQDIEAACRAHPFEKYQTVVEAAKQIMRHDYAFSTIDSYGDQLIRGLEIALAALEED